MRFRNTKTQNIKSRFKERYAEFCDKVLLGCLFLATCIPIVTIGSGIAALYYAVTKVINNDEGYLFRSYMKAWKDNMKQGIVLTICTAVYAGIGAADVCLVDRLAASGAIPTFAAPLIWLYFLPLVLVFPWMFLYMSRFNDSIGSILKNSFKIGLSNPGITLFLDLLAAGSVLMVLFALPLIPFAAVYICRWASQKAEPVLYEIAKNTPGFDPNAWYGRKGEEK